MRAVGEIGAGRGGRVEVPACDGRGEFGIVGQLDQGFGVAAEDQPHRTDEVGVLGGVGESSRDRLPRCLSAGRIPQHVDRVVDLVGVLGRFLADQHLQVRRSRRRLTDSFPTVRLLAMPNPNSCPQRDGHAVR